jgi:drug/metabolite transporter (DMT)-like permease
VTAVGARRLLARHSPLVVTGYSMALASVPYALVAAPQLREVVWTRVGLYGWTAIVGSAALALGVGYVIWYSALQRIGGTRTAVYQNLVPIVGIAIAWLWLGEPVGTVRIAGAAAILLGVALTKVQRGAEPAPEA